MRRLLFPLLSIALLVMPRMATAAPIVFNFCGFAGASATCDGLSEASISFDANTITPDVNDYNVQVRFTPTATGGRTNVDLFSFSINGVATPAGYNGVPIQTGGPAGAFVFDNISNSNACLTSTGQSQEVCFNTNTPAALPNIFAFTVDLAGSFLVADGIGLNLRARFTNPDGSFDGPIMSPDGQYDTHGGPPPPPPPPPPPSPVPEPASMFLLGTGLLAAFKAKRRT